MQSPKGKKSERDPGFGSGFSLKPLKTGDFESGYNLIDPPTETFSFPEDRRKISGRTPFVF